MIRKNIVFLFLVSHALHSIDPLHQKAIQTAEKVFGAQGVDLSLTAHACVEKLLHQLATTSPYEQQQAALKAAAMLDKELDTREAQAVTSDKKTNELVDFNLTILTVQKKHYDRMARLLIKDISPFAQLTGWLKSIAQKTIALLLYPFKNYTPTIDLLAEHLVEYTKIEDSEILTNYQKTLQLLVSHNQSAVPLMIRFWSYPKYRNRLLNGVKKFQQYAKPQADAVEAAELLAKTIEDMEAATAAAREAGAKPGEAIVDGTTPEDIAADKALTKAETDQKASLEDLSNDKTLANAVQKLEADSTPVDSAVLATFEKGSTLATKPVDSSAQSFDTAATTLEQGNKEELTNVYSNIKTPPSEAESAALAQKTIRSRIANSKVVKSAGRAKKFAGKNMRYYGYDGDLLQILAAPLKISFKIIKNGYKNDFKSMTSVFRGKKAITKPIDESANQSAAPLEQESPQVAGLVGKPTLTEIPQPEIEDLPEEPSFIAQTTDFDDGTSIEDSWDEEGASSDSSVNEESSALDAQTQTAPLEAVTSWVEEEGFMSFEEGSQEIARKLVAKGYASQKDIDEVFYKDYGAGEDLTDEEKYQALKQFYNDKQVEQISNTPTAMAPKLARWQRFKAWVQRSVKIKPMYELMKAMVLQAETSMGGQIVSTWQSTKDANALAVLQAKQVALNTGLTTFFSQLAVYEKDAFTKIGAYFSSEITAIAAQLSTQTTSSGATVLKGLLPALFAVEQAFIMQSLISATIKNIFLLNPMADDQLFYYSPMAVQVSQNAPSTWYNPYRSGNWQFCEKDYSGTTGEPVTTFVQYQAVPFINKNYPQGDPTVATQNSIFTDYIPPVQYNENGVQSYTINIMCTLLSEPATPFMMGILFNGARWISGVLDLHHQHRLLCLYTLPGQKAGTYNVGFAETFYQNQTGIQQNQLSDQTTSGQSIALNAIWPAYQLLSPEITALAPTDTYLPPKNPVTITALPIGTPYIFSVTTTPGAIAFTISTVDGTVLYPPQTNSSDSFAANATVPTDAPPQVQGSPDTTKKQPTPHILSGLNPLMFLYHNIGFLAPGCSAQFAIINPLELCLSEEQIGQVKTSLLKGTA